MRIAFLAAANSIHTLRWVNSLAEQGHQILVLSIQKPIEQMHASVSFKHLPIPAPLGYFTNTYFAQQQIKAFQADIVHAHYASGYGTLARKLNFHPTVLSVWGSDIYCFPQISAWHRNLVARNLNFADVIASTSVAMAKETEKLGVTKPIKVTPFGIDTNVFAPKSRSQEGLIIGTVKTLAPGYGIDFLIRAFALARLKGLSHHSRLMLVGDGPQRKDLEKLCRQLDIMDSVDFIGQVPHVEVPDYLNQLDVYLALSLHESFGVAVLEASACEIPVIVTDVGGLPEVVVAEKTGYVVPAKDPEMAANYILKLAKSQKLRTTMGQAGRKFVMEHYSWKQSVAKMQAVYDALLD